MRLLQSKVRAMPSHVRIFWWLSVAIAVYWVTSTIWFIAFQSPHELALMTKLPAGLRDGIRREAFELGAVSTAFWCTVTLGTAWLAAFRRQTWARWAFTLLFVFRLVAPLVVAASLGLLLAQLKRFAGEWLSPETYVIRVLTVLAIAFIFTGNARDWFAAKATAS